MTAISYAFSSFRDACGHGDGPFCNAGFHDGEDGFFRHGGDHGDDRPHGDDVLHGDDDDFLHDGDGDLLHDDADADDLLHDDDPLRDDGDLLYEDDDLLRGGRRGVRALHALAPVFCALRQSLCRLS